MSAMSLMLPESLLNYEVLIQNYMHKQMVFFQQKYKILTEPTQSIMKNYDIQMYSLRINDGSASPEQQSDQEITDDNLLKRIQQYNRIAKPNKGRDKDKNRRNRRNGEEEGKPKRKIRTTITPAKLEEMNKIFKQYIENLEKSRDFRDQDGICSAQSDRQAEYGSLKLIGQRLGLGYSTILHKFREYRATRKVKGGALIASINQKRKYKKSREIQQLIERSLSESTFYTAVQLSKYIQNKYNKTLSRSIISRHLGEMGYSYKNVKTNRPVNKNTNQIKELRKNFAAALALQRDKHLAQIYYLDEYVFSFDQNTKKLIITEFEDEPMLQITLIVFGSPQGIIKYEITNNAIDEHQFHHFFKEVQQYLSSSDEKEPKILVMDMDNPMHFSEKMIQARKRLKQQNVRIFYQPPYSHKLNILEWLFIGIKKCLSDESYGSVEQLRQKIEELVGVNCISSMQTYQKQAQTYIRKSMIMQNF